MTRAIWMMTGLLLLAPGCRPTGTVQCQDSTHCDLSSGGVCLANFGTERQWCGYPDTECPTGLRWSELDVGDGVSGRCVEPRVLDKTPPVVASKSPSPDTQQVAPSTLVTITFSEAMDPASVTASTLRLEDQAGNLVDSLIVTNGTEVVMTPRPALDPRLEYRITVTPEVTDVAGNGVVEPVSWTFRTRDAAWSTPVFLEQEQSKKASEVAVAAAGGVVVAAWVYRECSGSNCTVPDEVWAAVRKGGIWGAPVKLGSSPDGARDLAVGIDSSGRAVVAWGQGGVFSTGRLLVANYTGSAWTPALELLQDRARRFYPGNFVADPAIPGKMLFVWSDFGIILSQSVWFSFYSEAGGWAQPTRVSQSLSGQHTSSSPMLSEPDGKTLFWNHETTEGHEFFLARRTENTWSSRELVATALIYMRANFLAMNGNDLTLFWQNDHAFSRRLANGIWEATVQLDSASSPAAESGSTRPSRVRYTRNGTAIALWGSASDVWQSARPSGQGWGPPIAIDNDAGPATDLQLVAGGRRALAAWRTSDIWFNEYGESVGWRGAALMETQPTAVVSAAVAYDAATNTFVAVWSQANAAGVPDVLSATYR